MLPSVLKVFLKNKKIFFIFSFFILSEFIYSEIQEKGKPSSCENQPDEYMERKSELDVFSQLPNKEWVTKLQKIDSIKKRFPFCPMKKIGQLFIVELPLELTCESSDKQKKMKGLQHFNQYLSSLSIGGVIFLNEVHFQINKPNNEFLSTLKSDEKIKALDNIKTNNEGLIKDMLNQFKKGHEHPLFLSIDQEGGRVRRVKEYMSSNLISLPGAETYGKYFSKFLENLENSQSLTSFNKKSLFSKKLEKKIRECISSNLLQEPSLSENTSNNNSDNKKKYLKLLKQIQSLQTTSDKTPSSQEPINCSLSKSPSDTPKSCSLNSIQNDFFILGKGLKALGFNWNFAPVADLAIEGNPVIKNLGRGISDNPIVVSAVSNAMTEGMTSAKVISSVKHFPGHGRTAQDSHTESVFVDKDFEQLSCSDLIPFMSAIEKKVPTIMVGHIQTPNVKINQEPFLPATLSFFWIKQILRKQLNYKGVIITDDLSMSGFLNAVPDHEVRRSAEFAFKAGSDIVIIRKGEELSMIENLCEKLENEEFDCHLNENRKNTFCKKPLLNQINASVERVLNLKAHYLK